MTADSLIPDAATGTAVEASDSQLMARLKSGDQTALGSLVDRHKDCLVNYLARITGHRDRGEEMAQEAFLRLFQTASRYREEGRLLPYLYRIATNLARTEERRERRFRLFSQVSIRAPYPMSEPHSHASAPARLLQQEAQREVQRALSELPLQFRAAVVLHGVEGWTYQEIARSLGCSEGTVKSRVHRGHLRLRERLRSYWKGESS
ncbi:MAG: RNA polymerase sigma factor [Acidobacteriota bacterium]